MIRIAFALCMAFTALCVHGADARKYAVLSRDRGLYAMQQRLMNEGQGPNSVATEVWSGISGAEKMRMLQGILREEVARTVRALLKESH